jgi:hypothetical protein
MVQQNRAASEVARKDFVLKLGRFRETLSDDEKVMLDALTITAEGARGPADLQGYQWFWGNEPASPSWYSGVLPPGETSLWWDTYNTPWD